MSLPSNSLDPIRNALIAYLEERCITLDPSLDGTDFSWDYNQDNLSGDVPQGMVYFSNGSSRGDGLTSASNYNLVIYLRLMFKAPTDQELHSLLNGWAYHLILKPDSVLRRLRFGDVDGSAVDPDQLELLSALQILEYKTIPSFDQDEGGTGRLIVQLALDFHEEISFSTIGG